MLWLYLLAVVLLGIVVAALLGRWEGAAVPGEESDLVASDVDDLLQSRAGRHITAADLQEVRLDSAVRGYRMDQVDRLLDALGEQLHELEQSQAGGPTSVPTAAPGPDVDRRQKLLEPDSGVSDPVHAAPDKDLSLPLQGDRKSGFPSVE